MKEIVERVNIRQYPEQIIVHPVGSVITFGDMHGNAMKFIWELIRNGIITLNKERFDQLWEIYDREWMCYRPEESTSEPEELFLAPELARNLLKEFSQLISDIAPMKLGGNLVRIRLLGDFIAERGKCDIMQLRVLQKLVYGGVGVEMIASNHDMFFLPSYNQARTGEWHVLSTCYWNFITNLEFLIKNKIVEHKELLNLMQEVYLPNLRLISYTLTNNKEKIILFTHSPIQVRIIEDLAAYFNAQFAEIRRPDLTIVCNATTAQNLADTIDALNNSFRKLFFINFKKWQEILLSNQCCQGEVSSANDPLMCLLWNYKQLSRDGEPDFIERVIHGHIGSLGEDDYCVSLDTDLGKFPGDRTYFLEGVDRLRDHLYNFERNKYCHFAAIEPPFQRLSREQEMGAIDEGIKIAYTESIEIIKLAKIVKDQYGRITADAALLEGEVQLLNAKVDELEMQREGFVARCRHLAIVQPAPVVVKKPTKAQQDHIKQSIHNTQLLIDRIMIIKEKIGVYFGVKDLLKTIDNVLKKHENLVQMNEAYAIYGYMTFADTSEYVDKIVEYLCNKVRTFYSSDTDFCEEITELQQRCKLSNKEDEIMLFGAEVIPDENKIGVITELFDLIDQKASLEVKNTVDW